MNPSGAFFHLPDSVESPSLARSFVMMRTETFPQRVRDVVELLVSEIVTNAFRHGSPPVRVDVSISGTVVRVKVYDHGRTFDVPIARAVESLDEAGGWGLSIVDRLATGWGIDAQSWGAGKAVWFELDSALPVLSDGRAS